MSRVYVWKTKVLKVLLERQSQLDLFDWTFDLRLNGDAIFTNALGESGGASKIGSSGFCSEICLWVGLRVWPEFVADPAALGSGVGFWFAVELDAAVESEAGDGPGSVKDELLGVLFGWAGAAVSASGLPHVEVPLRPLTEPDFTRKETPLSWEAVLQVQVF